MTDITEQEKKINEVYDYIQEQKRNKLDLVTINKDNVSTLTSSLEHISANKKTDEFSIDKLNREWRYIIGLIIGFVFNYILAKGEIIPKQIEDNFLGYFGLGCLTFVGVVFILTHYSHRQKVNEVKSLYDILEPLIKAKTLSTTGSISIPVEAKVTG